MEKTKLMLEVAQKVAEDLRSLADSVQAVCRLVTASEPGNIDSSLDSGKMMISILGAMAEIERDNISVQSADFNGRFCGAKRTRCGASGLIYSY